MTFVLIPLFPGVLSTAEVPFDCSHNLFPSILVLRSLLVFVLWCITSVELCDYLYVSFKRTFQRL